MLPALSKNLKNAAILVLIIISVTFLCRILVIYAFDISLESKTWYRDYLGNIAVSLIVALLVQSLKKSLWLAGVTIVMFQLGNALKLSILGTPVSPDDFFNIQNFFFLTDGWRRIVLYAIAAFPAILALLFIPWKKPGLWFAVGALVIAAITINLNSKSLRVVLDTQLGNSVWNQPKNYRDRGVALHIAQETIRTFSKVNKPPASDEVELALDTIANTTAQSDDQQGDDQRILESELMKVISSGAVKPERNLHILVLESFFDPVTLGEQWVPEDPLPEDFRELWEQTDSSTLMAPVFGGYTANSEFEMLCGFPVLQNAVFFEGWLRNAAPCLPKLLADAGYRTIASHPNVPGFWNRNNAYPLIGFDEYLSKENFDMSDSVGTLLMDRSMYAQVYSHIEKTVQDEPVFNYMLTYYGHLPYPSSEAYPDKISAGQDSVLLHGYLNQIWYKSRDLMERIDILRREDPDALIVAFGDHLPFLGQNYGVYTQAWDLPGDRSEFTGKQLQQLTSPPLIVIDGKRGPLKLGKVPLYRMPSLIMSLLGLTQTQPFDITANPDGILVRPVYGMHFTTSEAAADVCVDTQTAQLPCKTSQPWLSQISVLIDDLFSGKQIILQQRESTDGANCSVC